MKIVEFLLDRIVFWIVTLLTPIIISVLSKVTTGNWMKWFSILPKIFWIIFGVFILFWLVIIVIYKRFKKIREYFLPGESMVRFPEFYKVINLIKKLDYAGVKWVIIVPERMYDKLSNDSLREISSAWIEVDTPPRCPNCEAELEQSLGFFGGYVWKCIVCGFKKRNRNSYYIEVERAKRIAKLLWEKLSLDRRNK